MTMHNEVYRELKRWLKKSGNTPAKLAALIGYQSSNTIVFWCKKKKIPEHMLPIVWKALSRKVDEYES